MTTLYNCHTDGDEYRITKFADGEVESSYLCSADECQCPAGHRPTCRHRMMLPLFINRGAVNSYWFLDFDRKGWVSNEPANFVETRVAQKSAIAADVEMIEAIRQGCLGNFECSELGSQQVLSIEPHSPTVTTAEFDSADGSSILPAVAKAKWRRV